MQTKTHLALGHYLLNQEPDHGLHRHSGLFLIGCMEPDYNLATYQRGLRKHGVFHGHNAENSFTYVPAAWARLKKTARVQPGIISGLEHCCTMLRTPLPDRITDFGQGTLLATPYMSSS